MRYKRFQIAVAFYKAGSFYKGIHRSMPGYSDKAMRNFVAESVFFIKVSFGLDYCIPQS